MQKIAAIIIAIFLIGSCESTIENNVDILNKNVKKIVLTNTNGKIIYIINGNKSSEMIEEIISQRKPMMKKLLPVFNLKLVIDNGYEKQEWLFAKPNYLKRNLNNSKIYVIDKKLNLMNKLKELSSERM